jgi:hypothetical protein
MASLTLYELLRPWRLRRAVRRYEHHLKALNETTVPFLRANKLELMALYAEAISGYEHREPATREWGAAADILRAVAATERFCVLADAWPGRNEPVITSPGFLRHWEDLDRGAVQGDRRERAAVLRRLHAEAAEWDVPGVSVLEGIARTEDAAAAVLDEDRALVTR